MIGTRDLEDYVLVDHHNLNGRGNAGDGPKKNLETLLSEINRQSMVSSKNSKLVKEDIGQVLIIEDN